MVDFVATSNKLDVGGEISTAPSDEGLLDNH